VTLGIISALTCDDWIIKCVTGFNFSPLMFGIHYATLCPPSPKNSSIYFSLPFLLQPSHWILHLCTIPSAPFKSENTFSHLPPIETFFWQLFISHSTILVHTWEPYPLLLFLYLTFIFLVKLTLLSDDGGSTFLWNVG
jgi:hypothetical protein